MKLFFQTSSMAITAIAILGISKQATATNLTNNSTVSDDLAVRLQRKLDDNRGQTPGATVGITSPLGNWFGASGFADLETGTSVKPDDRFPVGSVTKTIVATTVLQLSEEGVLSLEDTLGQWLPDIASNIPDSNEVTIRQLLNGTGGIPDFESLLQQDVAKDLSLILKDWQPEELVAYIYDRPLFEGNRCYVEAQWCYPNTGLLLAGLIAEKATGSNMATVIRDRVLNPLGMNDTFFQPEETIPGGFVSEYQDLDGDGRLDKLMSGNRSWSWTAGAMISTAQDLTRFTRGVFDGELLQPDTLREMLTFVDTPEGYSYGIGTMKIESAGGTLIGHAGISFGAAANMWYVPELDITYTDLQNRVPPGILITPMLRTVAQSPQSVPEPSIIAALIVLGAGWMLKRMRSATATKTTERS